MKAQTRIDRAWLRRQFAPITAAWAPQARRIDALSLRERAILFLCIVAVLAALFDSLVLSPWSAHQRQRADQRRQQEAELAQAREAFVTASRGAADPAEPLRRQLEAARTERSRLDAALHDAAFSGGAQGLQGLLQRLLSRQPGLVLERLRLLDDSPAAPANEATASMLTDGMHWQGVELQVQGRWREAQGYLQALERELPGVRWGELRLASATAGELPRWKLQIFLLGVQP